MLVWREAAQKAVHGGGVGFGAGSTVPQGQHGLAGGRVAAIGSGDADRIKQAYATAAREAGTLYDAQAGSQIELVTPASVDAVAQALRAAATTGAGTVIIISADAMSPHQSVVTVMEAARRVGLTQITFATQSSAGARAANGR